MRHFGEFVTTKLVTSELELLRTSVTSEMSHLEKRAISKSITSEIGYDIR